MLFRSHGTIGQPDLVIIAPPSFIGEANRLASFRESNDGLVVAVVSTSEVYNEFSCGVQDITALKDLVRMLYNRAVDATELPRYLLLFGDGSYDNLNRILENTNFIPTYQSYNSIDPMFTYVADDYFGYDDAIYVSARFVQMLSRQDKKLSELVAALPQYHSTPEMRLNCLNDEEKFRINKEATAYFNEHYDCLDIDGVRIKFLDGWGLVRGGRRMGQQARSRAVGLGRGSAACRLRRNT